MHPRLLAGSRRSAQVGRPAATSFVVRGRAAPGTIPPRTAPARTVPARSAVAGSTDQTRSGPVARLGRPRPRTGQCSAGGRRRVRHDPALGAYQPTRAPSRRPVGAALLRVAVLGTGLAVVAGAVSALEGPGAAVGAAPSVALDRSTRTVPGSTAPADPVAPPRPAAATSAVAARSAGPQGQTAPPASAQGQASAEARVTVQLQATAQVRAARAQTADEAARSEMRDPRSSARLMLSGFGWEAGQFSCLDALWSRESGWNPRASNPSSGAFGIPQALPGSKMSSAGSDWATNPVTQIRWGLGYISDLYGTPCGAWAHSQATGWY